MNLTKAIAQRLQKILAERKIPQNWLYKNGGIPRSTICNIVNGNKKSVNTTTIYQICATLNMTLEEFFADPIFNNLDD